MAKKHVKSETELALEEIKKSLAAVQSDRDEIFLLLHKYQLDLTIAQDKINGLIQKLRSQ